MKRTATSWFLLAIYLFSSMAGAEPPSDRIPRQKVSRINSLIEQEVTRQNIPGLSIAIATDDEVRYARGFGFADLENSVPAKAITVYRTASIAKTFTATSVMQLVHEGKLELEASIRNYCPQFPEKRWPVTARHLLGHLSGVRHYRGPREARGTIPYYSVHSALNLFKSDPLLHEPGTRFRYTTYGYCVLGCAVENASGLTYGEYIRERIFQPARMYNTTIDDVRQIISNRARGYQKLSAAAYEELPPSARRDWKVGAVYNASLHDTSMKIPGGGLVSTAVDLVRFASAINHDRLLPRSRVEQMWTPQRTRDGELTGYSLGWKISEVDEHRAVGHSGGQAGTSTYFLLLPEQDVTVAVMSNLQGISLERLAAQLAKVLVSSQP